MLAAGQAGDAAVTVKPNGKPCRAKIGGGAGTIGDHAQRTIAGNACKCLCGLADQVGIGRGAAGVGLGLTLRVFSHNAPP